MIENDIIPIKKTRPAGTGQWRKLTYTKHHSDQFGVVWRISTWKVSLWLLAGIVGLLVLYSFFAEGGQGNFLESMLFYGIIILIIVLIGWVVLRFALKSRKLITGFLIGWILILGVLILLDLILNQWLGLMVIHFGTVTYIIVTAMAVLGSTRINGSLEKEDVLFGLLVLVVLLVGNYPIFEHGGFYAEVDYLLSMLAEKLSIVSVTNF